MAERVQRLEITVTEELGYALQTYTRCTIEARAHVARVWFADDEGYYPVDHRGQLTTAEALEVTARAVWRRSRGELPR